MKDSFNNWLCCGYSSTLISMTFDLHATVITLAVSFAHFLKGLLKYFLIWSFFVLFFVHCLHLEYPSSDESYESDEEEYDKLGSEYGSSGTFDTVFGELLRGVGLP